MLEAAKEPKVFWAVPGAGHVDLQRYGPVAYREIAAWLFSKKFVKQSSN